MSTCTTTPPTRSGTRTRCPLVRRATWRWSRAWTRGSRSPSGLANGEAHVIRNAGGVVTDDVIRSLAISQRLLGTSEIILIHHTAPGTPNVTDDSFKQSIEDDTGLRPPWAVEAFTDVEEDVRHPGPHPRQPVYSVQGRHPRLRLRRRDRQAQRGDWLITLLDRRHHGWQRRLPGRGAGRGDRPGRGRGDPPCGRARRPVRSRPARPLTLAEAEADTDYHDVRTAGQAPLRAPRRSS